MEGESLVQLYGLRGALIRTLHRTLKTLEEKTGKDPETVSKWLRHELERMEKANADRG